MLVDRFELTRGDWLFWDAPGARAAAERLGGAAALLEPGQEDLPAFLSFEEAAELARLRGMRLPRPQEWIHVAVGRRTLDYPWGPQPQQSWANTLELAFGGPTAVGTFENGKSRRFDAYDLLGNVWEWVDGVVPGMLDTADERKRWTRSLPGDRLASVMGGAFDTRARRTFGGRPPGPLEFHAMTLDRGTKSLSIGARMVAEAEPYLWAMAPRWGKSEEARGRVAAVGRRWSAASGPVVVVALLEALVAREGAPSSLGWLLEGARGRATPAPGGGS